MEKERRKVPRAKSGLPLKISADDQDFITHTENIGSNGALFRIEKAIPLMTRLEMTLLVPSAGPRQTTKKILCKGVVVRCESVDKKSVGGQHRIAVYFTSLKEPDRKTLMRYVHRVLEK